MLQRITRCSPKYAEQSFILFEAHHVSLGAVRNSSGLCPVVPSLSMQLGTEKLHKQSSLYPVAIFAYILSSVLFALFIPAALQRPGLSFKDSTVYSGTTCMIRTLPREPVPVCEAKVRAAFSNKFVHDQPSFLLTDLFVRKR